MAQSSSNGNIIIVGAGVVGCSIAFHLARAGARVRVFDKGGICGGMSARSGALVRMHYTFAPEAELAWKSHRYFQHWREIVGGRCGFVETGFAVVVDERNAPRLRANAAMLQRVGVDTEVVTAAELKNSSLTRSSTMSPSPHSSHIADTRIPSRLQSRWLPRRSVTARNSRRIQLSRESCIAAVERRES